VLRTTIAEKAIVQYGQSRGNRETENYAIALVCAAIVGFPLLLRVDFFQFLLPFVATDDSVIRRCTRHALANAVESLIPRVPRPPGVVTERITPENYDSAAFIDRPYPIQAVKQPRFLNFNELSDGTVLSQYFDNDIEERLAIHKLLFEQLVFKHGIIEECITQLVNSQVLDEETFSKPKVAFWSSLCRFFGLDFIRKIMDEVRKLTDASGTVATHAVAAEMFGGCLCSLKTRPYADVAEVSSMCRPIIPNLIENLNQEFHTVWSFSFITIMSKADARRMFWLFEDFLSCIPKTDRLRAVRAIAFLSDILTAVGHRMPYLRLEIEEISAQPLFSESALEFENVRECSVRCLTALLGLTFDIAKRGQNPESKRLLNRFVEHANDTFIVQWLLAQFTTQSIAGLASGGYLAEHLKQYVDMILDKDEIEESRTRTAVMLVIGSNWLGSICDQPPTAAGVLQFVSQMLELLLPQERVWQLQTALLVLTEELLAGLFFFLDESVLENLIMDRIIPGLLQQHPDVQDAAGELLAFVVKSSLGLSEKLPSIVDTFKTMLIDKEMLNRRIAGAKGLSSVISGTLLFDSVPEYVVDAFQALSDAHEIDSSVEQVITQFFSDFWGLHDNNLAPDIADVLAPFHAHLRPTYFT
jgi:hypothetical protein